MGKNQHSKDRLFITRTEWQRDYGGKKQEREAQYRRAWSACHAPCARADRAHPLCGSAPL